MYRLAVSKGRVDNYAISVSKEGSCIEDHIALDDGTAKALVAECASLLKLGTPSLAANTGKVSLDTYNNAFQMIVHISDNFVKAYHLTRTELKLFQASLRRALDG